MLQLIMVLVFAAMTPCIIAQNTTDLLRNGNMTVAGKDINGLPDGWESKYCEGVETTASFKTIMLDGKKAAELTWVGGSSNFGIQPVDNIKFEQGKAYEFSARGKTGGEGKLQLVVEIHGSANIGRRLLVCEATEEIASSAEWSKLAVCFEVPAKAADVKVW